MSGRETTMRWRQQNRQRARRKQERLLHKAGMCALLIGVLLIACGRSMGRLAAAEDAGQGGAPAAISVSSAVSSISLTPSADTHETKRTLPSRLVALEKANPETEDYVEHYWQYCGTSQVIDLSAEAKADAVPLLLQWDSRWGYESYGDGLMGYTGCGPTCLSMAALYLTGDADATPLAVAHYADQNGYYVDGSGSSWDLMRKGGAAFGLASQELPLEESVIKSALDRGEVIICAMGPGDFTTNGHFIVLAGYGTDGKFELRDPNSRTHSERDWSYEELKSQIRNLWAFSKA